VATLREVRLDLVWCGVSLRAAVLAASVVSSSIACAANAQDALERALASMEEAEFERAIAELDEAERGELERDALIALYGHRALASFALGRIDRVEVDVARLLALGADAHLPANAPPEVREIMERLFREGAGPPRIDVHARINERRAHVEAEVEGGADLVRELLLWARTEGEWSSFRSPLELAVSDALSYYVEALGPSDVLLATDGTRDRPNVLRPPIVAASIDDDVIWGVALGGGGAAALAAIVAIVALSIPSDAVQVSGPRLEL
jgi:hypothetical protein